MRALQLQSLDGPDGVELVELPEPGPGDGVIIEAMAAAATFSDLLISQGRYQTSSELPFVIGADVAGVVRDAPDGAAVRPGDRAMAVTQGAFAETVVAPVEKTFRIPDPLSFDEAAGFVMNYHTAHTALHRRGRLAAGETVLVHGAAGGVGTATVQVAKATGARVIAIAGSQEKAAIAREAGADDVVLTSEDWVAAVREMTQGRGADVIMDPVGGERFDLSVRCLATEGRLLVVGFTSGEIPVLKVNRLLLRNADVVGVYAFIDQSTADALAGLVEEGLRPLVGEIYPFERGAEALRALDGRVAVKKLVIRIRDDH